MSTRKRRRGSNVNKGQLELQTLIEKFELYHWSAGHTAKTVRWHNQALGLFLNWLRAEGISTRQDDLGEDEAMAFVRYLRMRPGNKGLAARDTVNNRVRSLRAFFNWLYRKGYTDTHRLEDLDVPKTTQKEIEILTDEEIARIFGSFDTDALLGARNAAIISIMLDTGLRLSEVATLKFRDVHLKERNVKVLGKGDKERIVVFGTKCQHALLNYMERFRVENAEDAVDTFFLSKDGNSLKPDGFRSLVNRLSKAAGVSRLHAHLMRHTYATRFLLNGGNVFLLQMNLGHTSLAMVRRYVHIASRMAALFSQEFSPLDRVGTWGVECLDHCLNGDGWQGQIFSNAGKATQLSAVPQVGRRSGACGSTGVSLEERILPGSATA